MEKRSVFKQIGISVLLFIVVYFISSIILQTVDTSINGEYVDEMYVHPLVELMSVAFAALAILMEYTGAKSRYATFFLNNSENLKSSISIYEKKRDNLVEKAKEVVDNYLDHEKDTHVSLSRERLSTINSVVKLESMVESYPELRSIESVNQLLQQISQMENEVSDIKQIYNNSVSEYNTAISVFPINLFGRKQRMAFYEED